MTKLIFSLGFIFSLFLNTAYAARPFMTDDARLTTEGSCQLESWVRRYKDKSEVWALPACNPTGNFEVTAGGGHFPTSGMPSSNDYVIQGKGLFRPLTTNDWGWGLAVGRVNHPSSIYGPNNLGNSYAYIPLSISRLDDKLVFHMNLGISHDTQSATNISTWGVGAEYWAHPRVMVIAETYGDNRQNPLTQTGLRFSIVPGLFQVDMTRGVQPGNSSVNSWISFGIRYTPDKLF